MRNSVAQEHQTDQFRPQRPNNPAKRNGIFYVAIGLVVIIGGIFGFNKLQKAQEEKVRQDAIMEAVAPIMENYDISDFKVKRSANGDVSLYAEDFKGLRDNDKFSCIYDISKLRSVTTKKGGSISLSGVDIYVSPSAYYYRVTTAQVTYLGYYSKAGLYYADGGSRVCVYEIDN